MKKKLMGLIILLTLIIVAPVKAETIDMKGDYIPNKTVYKSGTVFTNVKVTNGSEIYLYIPKYNVDLSYRVYVTSYDTYANNPLVGATNSYSDVYPYFYWNSDKIFLKEYGIEENVKSPILLPRIDNVDGLWLYYVRDRRNAPSEGLVNRALPYDESDSRDSYWEEDYFEYMGMEPSFEVECDKEDVDVNETTQCSVYYNFDSSVFGYLPYIFSYDLLTDDYEISNIQPTIISSNPQVRGNHVTGDVGIMFNYDLNKEEEILKNMSYICYSEITEDNQDISNNTQLRLAQIVGQVIATEDDEDDEIDCNGYTKFKVLTFDATAKNNPVSNGKVGLANTKIDYYHGNDILNGSLGESIFSMDMEVEPAIIPIKGIVKGEEEVEEVVTNPPTGLKNYAYLILIAGLFAIGYYSVSKKKIFKKL